MRHWLQLLGWLACVVYSTIPSFWLMIHPFAERWRARHRSPFIVLLPAWLAMWVFVAQATSHWRGIRIYHADWTWGAAALLFACGLYIYSRSGKSFTAKQLGGLPELHAANRDQRLVTDGIRSRVRHPVYLAHLCEMLAWSIGTGLVVCWALTALAVLTGAIMIRTEDAELEKRFGEDYRTYRRKTPALLPAPHSKGHEPRPRLSVDGTFIHYEMEKKTVWQIAITDLVCIGEYTTASGPWADDYFLVFAIPSGLYYEASMYSDGRDATLESLNASLGCELRLGLIQSTTFSSRVLWPARLEGCPFFVGAKTTEINPDVRNMTQ